MSFEMRCPQGAKLTGNEEPYRALLIIHEFEMRSPTINSFSSPPKPKLLVLNILHLLVRRTMSFKTHCPSKRKLIVV